jgi:putative spermidine/putrescine transport system substrate-binding protein
MKKVLAIVMTAALTVTVLAGCAKKVEEPTKLVISTFGLSEDIVTRDIYEPFEKANNVEIIVETGTTSERYTKLESNPAAGVDLIELSQATAAKGYAKGLFEKIDYSKIPNAAKLIASTKGITEKGFGPAYTINSIGIIYNKEAAGMEIDSWEDLWDPSLAGKISIPDIATTFGPAMVHVASDYKGVDIKTDNGTAGFEALAELKPNIVKTYAKSSDLANMFKSGEIAVAVVGDFAIPIISAADPAVEYVVPSSGTYANFNTIDINVNSKNKELAYKFIDWRISQELQTVTAKSLNEAPVNSGVVLDAETAKNKTYGDVAKNAKTIDYSFVNPILSGWVDTWNKTLNN